MRPEPGRLAAMVAEAKADESAIICDSTLYHEDIDNAVCRGFYDRHLTQPLQIAERLGLVEFDRNRSLPAVDRGRTGGEQESDN